MTKIIVHHDVKVRSTMTSKRSYKTLAGMHPQVGSWKARIMVKVFLTGGTGFIGSRVAQSLVAGGHIVTALSRRTGTNLDQLNVKILQGTLKDVDAIEAAAADADAVFHLGFEHDFARYPECCKQDVSVVTAIVKALSGSGKLFVNTAGSAADDTGGSLGTEAMPSWGPRAESQAISFKVCQAHALLQSNRQTGPYVKLGC